jgi:small conductance mechanosensitive channel
MFCPGKAAMDLKDIYKLIEHWLITKGPQTLLVIIIMFVALKLTRALTARGVARAIERTKDPEYQKRAETLGSVLRYVFSITIVIVASMVILRQIGIEIGPIIAAAGIVGLAVGFGAQHLVQDIISGFFILFEDQIRVGDVVQIADKGGLVEKVNLRMVILRDLAGNVHYIRNGKIDIVTNMTKEYSRYVFDIGVAYREDVDEVIEAIKAVDEELRNDPEYRDDILEPIEILGLDQFADSAIIIKARTKTMPIQQWRVGREFNRRLKKKFDELDIEIPFPHMTLYVGEDKTGRAAPLRVQIKTDGSRGDEQQK